MGRAQVPLAAASLRVVVGVAGVAERDPVTDHAGATPEASSPAGVLSQAVPTPPHRRPQPLSAGPRGAGEHVRLAVALASPALEAADLEPAQPLAPGAGHPRPHPRPAQLLGRGVEELDRRANAGPPQAASAGLRDAGEVGELQAFE